MGDDSGDDADDVPPSGLEKVSFLGEGSYGKVYYLSNCRAGKVYRNCADSHYGLPRDAVKEISILSRIRNRYIIECQQSILDGDKLWAMMEFAPYGDLCTYLAKVSSDDLRFVAKSVCYQIFASLAVLHCNGITHRDIKPENFLIVNSNPVEFHIKLTDVGCALVAAGRDPGCLTPRTDPITSIWYRAPEVALGVRSLHTPAMDIWAAGLMVYEICLFRKPLFRACMSAHQLRDAIYLHFGVPTEENRLMPSYFCTPGGHFSLPSKHDYCSLRPVKPAFHRSDIPPWAAPVLCDCLVLEPSLRPTAFNCAFYLDSERAGTELGVQQCFVDTDQVASKFPEEPYLQNIRARACEGVYLLTVRDRRVFHTACGILDLINLSGAHLSSSNMTLLCATSISIACKICESEQLVVPHLWFDFFQAPRQFRSEYVPVSNREVVDTEVLVLRRLDFKVWRHTPFDVPTASDITDPIAYNYILDMMTVYCSTVMCGIREFCEIARAMYMIIKRSNGPDISVAASLIDTFDSVLNNINSAPDCSPVKAAYRRRCPEIVCRTITVKEDQIHWV